MKRYQLGYALFLLFSLLLLYFSGNAFLMGLVFTELLFPSILRLMLRREARKIRVGWIIPESAGAGQCLQLEFPLKTGNCFAAGTIWIDFQMENRLLSERENRSTGLPIKQSKDPFREEIRLENCGSYTFHCLRVQIQDLFGLFRLDLACPEPRSVLVYPKHIKMELLKEQSDLQRQMDGRSAQNKKGHDRTEIYDLRQYIPGDDIRSIHWKLSSKLGKQIVREAGSSTQLRTLILLDIGQTEEGEKCTDKLLCTGISLASCLSEVLVYQGYAHAVGISFGQELHFMQVTERESHLRAVESELAVALPKKSGQGLLRLLLQRSENPFTRMYYITTAREVPIRELRSLNGTEVTVLQLENAKGKLHYSEEKGVEVLSIPAEEEFQDAVKIRL